MGRRPIAKTQAQVPVAGFTPEIQVKVNLLAAKLFDKAAEELEKRLGAGALEGMTFKELMTEIRRMMTAVKGPATSLNAVILPSAPQDPRTVGYRTSKLRQDVKDPEKRRRLRESAETFLEGEKED